MKSIMSSLIKYLLAKYPYKSELSDSRLSKMLYLADWKSSIVRNVQITNVVWHFHHYGICVDDFLKIAKEDPDIDVVNAGIMFGERKQKIELKKEFNGSLKAGLDDIEIEILDFVIEATKNKNYEELIKLVCSTYPVVSSSSNADFDLVKMAHDYKAIAEESSSKALQRTSH